MGCPFPNRISVEMEDKWARDFLVQQAKDENNEIEFYDYSGQDPLESKWETGCKKCVFEPTRRILTSSVRLTEF